MKKFILSFVIFILVSSFVFAEVPSLKVGIAAEQKQGVSANLELGDQSGLTDAEIAGLLRMREEEKLARDVYLTLYTQWDLAIFQNIAASEQTHTDAVKELLDAFDIKDPVVSDESGVFVDEELAALYDSLVSQGSESILDALVVGATIEDLDIKDLSDLLEDTDNERISLVYENLRKGSRNHLRSFYSQIESRGGSYEAQYISSEELSDIVQSDKETGALLDSESHIALGSSQEIKMKGKGMGSQGNGLHAQVKVMPETASATALERLRLNVCDEDCTIELKEVGEGNEAKSVYEVKAQKTARVFGLFNAKLRVQAQVDAQTGEVISVNTPWWGFLAQESEE